MVVMIMVMIAPLMMMIMCGDGIDGGCDDNSDDSDNNYDDYSDDLYDDSGVAHINVSTGDKIIFRCNTWQLSVEAGFMALLLQCSCN